MISLLLFSALSVGIFLTIKFVSWVCYADSTPRCHDYARSRSCSQTRPHQCRVLEQRLRLGWILLIGVEETIALEHPVPGPASLRLLAVGAVQHSQLIERLTHALAQFHHVAVVRRLGQLVLRPLRLCAVLHLQAEQEPALKFRQQPVKCLVIPPVARS